MFPRRKTLSGLPRIAALLAVFALAFHAFLPLTQQAVRAAQAANGIEQVVLCSALGSRSIALKDGAPVDTDPAKGDKISQSCLVCLTAGGQPAILPAACEPAMPLTAVTVLYGAVAGSILAQATHLPQQARAPPALSLS